MQGYTNKFTSTSCLCSLKHNKYILAIITPIEPMQDYTQDIKI